MKTNWLIICVLLILTLTGCSGLIGAGNQAPTSTPVMTQFEDSEAVIAEGNVMPRDSARLYTRTGGEVFEVLVKEGDSVAKDAVILRLGDRATGDKDTRQAALAAAQLEEKSAQKALDDLKNSAALAAASAQDALVKAEKALIDAQQALDDFDSDQYQTDLDNLIKDANIAKDDLKDAQDEFDKYKELDQDNADRKRTDQALQDAQKKYDDSVRKRDLKINEMDVKKAQVSAAQAKRDDSQREYDNRKNGPDATELALAEARLASAQAQVKASEAAIDAIREVRAPFAGVITSLDVVVGETVLPNQSVGQIADFSEWFVDTNDLTEMEVVKITEGQAATIIPDSMEDLNLPATVETIDRESGKKGGDVTYTVRLKLEKTDPRLRWGMTVEVHFGE